MVNLVYSVASTALSKVPRQESSTPRRDELMRRVPLVVVVVAVTMLASMGMAQHASTAGPYKVLKTAKVGGEGGFDYISADVEGRRLYVPRSGPMGHLMVFNLDTLEAAGTMDIHAGGAVVDPKS